ncbi:hypothetical protein [Limnovirga soli]|uniref:Uncharacterized protein n=1 Tax=Limnovirga soli TaxID=2656915 RepID=A0A8J8JYK1_9BACT|nr:hypothetical protein [Limnovirga soli]NNV57381.1 hypothetical protein [Limnovirga soli]
MVQFNNNLVAAKYEAVFDKDKNITLPGKFSGKLSNITPEVAELLIQTGDNQIKLKAAPAPKPEPGKKEKEDPKN